MTKLLAVLFLGVSMLHAQDSSLLRAEKVTESEKKQLASAQEKIAKANGELLALQIAIAKAHDMKAESWMEWSTWYEFDGDFILFRHSNHMEGMRGNLLIR